MQLSVQKHHIQIALKYILLKYIISLISSSFKKHAKVNIFFTREWTNVNLCYKCIYNSNSFCKTKTDPFGVNVWLWTISLTEYGSIKQILFMIVYCVFGFCVGVWSKQGSSGWNMQWHGAVVYSVCVCVYRLWAGSSCFWAALQWF